MENIIEITGLTKTFGKHEVLKGIDLQVQKGDVISIIGASGSGKSTLLRCVNLLETPTGGEITYHGDSVLTKLKAHTYRSHLTCRYPGRSR